MRYRVVLRLLFLFFLASIAFLSAQTYQGRILGTITDSSGAVVADAKVTLRDTATNVSRSLVTNHAGEYVAPDLEPGTYSVSAEAPASRRQKAVP